MGLIFVMLFREMINLEGQDWVTTNFCNTQPITSIITKNMSSKEAYVSFWSRFDNLISANKNLF